MCGFTGFISREISTEHALSTCKEMANKIIHRGPDDAGEWVDMAAGIALAHRRLAIQDISVEGHQPMSTFSGRYVIAYNGEVYNFPALRRDLESKGCIFRGHSDTEVVLSAIENWGLEAAVKRFVGMFAFALWDKQERLLRLVRDRLGIKPLYYGWVANSFVFASELKAIRAFPGFDLGIDRGALALLMRHCYVPAPHSIYQNLFKLLPGHILTLGSDAVARRQLHVSTFWSARDVAETGVAEPFAGTRAEAVTQLDGLLREAVGMRMVSDVSLGAFLSGGYDSSLIVALMQDQSEKPVKTFSIGFHEGLYNEANHAKAVATHLGTDHTELYVTPAEAMAVIPCLPTLYDEPFSDSSQIPTFLVSQLARRHVTVSLTGDGGDELFSGYNRYVWGVKTWNLLKLLPQDLRSTVAKMVKAVPFQLIDKIFEHLMPMLPQNARIRLPGDKMHKILEIISANGPDDLYLRLVSQWKDPCSFVLGATEPLTALTDYSRKSGLTDFAQKMMFTDLVSYLPDDILVKVDRASMGVSLEARVPLLDHRVVEFAWRLPQSIKLRNGEAKWILRQVLYKYVPCKLMDRPKMGFGVPIGHWLCGPLRDWAESLLNESRLRNDGFFDPGPIRTKWSEHLSGNRGWHYYLWNVLMFQAWHDSL